MRINRECWSKSYDVLHSSVNFQKSRFLIFKICTCKLKTDTIYMFCVNPDEGEAHLVQYPYSILVDDDKTKSTSNSSYSMVYTQDMNVFKQCFAFCR